MYGRSALGKMTFPPFVWLFSRTDTMVLGNATPDPFSVWRNSLFM